MRKAGVLPCVCRKESTEGKEKKKRMKEREEAKTNKGRDERNSKKQNDRRSQSGYSLLASSNQEKK